MGRTPLWLVLMLLLTGCAGELVLEKDGALAVIPRRDSASSLLLVDAKVNDKGPFRFALDSAASISVLLDSTADAAGIRPISGTRVLVRGMTGSGTHPAVAPESVSVGSLEWRPELLALLPNTAPMANHMDGLLGMDFLSQYAVAYFADERAVRLYPKHITEGPGFRGWISIPLHEIHLARSDATVLVFDMNIAGELVPTILDIGAESSLMNHRAARAIGVRLRRHRQSEVAGATGPTIIASELIFWQIRIGNHLWHRRNFLVADFPVFEALSLHRRPAAIAGIDLFRDHDFVIDYEGMRLLVRWK